MAEQTNIIQESTQRFAAKFKSIAEVRVKDHHDDNNKDGQSVIEITFLSIEEVTDRNMTVKVKCEETDSNNDRIEFFKPPASMFKLSFMVTPRFKTSTDTLKIMGEIAKLMKDDNQIPVDEYDWVENHRESVRISAIPDMNLERQMKVFDFIKSDYRPSLFYQFVVGIDSEKKEIFRRVKERKITADFLDKVKQR